MADVVVCFENIFTTNLIIKKCFFVTNGFFEKTPSLKNLKKFTVIAPSIMQILGI